MDISTKIDIAAQAPKPVAGALSFKSSVQTGTDVAVNTSVTTPPANQRQQQSDQQLQDAVAKINDYVQNEQRKIRFSVDEETGRDVVTVLDSETKEVIRQIPTEEVLVFVRNLKELNTDELTLFSSQA